MKKKIKGALIGAAIASVGILGGVSAGVSQIFNHHAVQNNNSNETINKEYLNVNDKNGYDLTYSVTGPQVCYGTNGAAAVRDSDIGLYKAIIYVNNTTGEVEWKYDDSIVEIMNILYSRDAINPYFTVFGRNENGNKNNQMFIMNISEKTGAILGSTTINGIGGDYKDYCLYQATNDPHRFTVQNRKSMSDNGRNGYNYLVTTSANDPSVINVTVKNWTNTTDATTNFFVLGSGSYVAGADTYDVRMLAKDIDGHRIIFKIYKNFQQIYSWDTTIDYDDGVYGEPGWTLDIDLVDALNSSIYVDYSYNEVTFGTFKTGDKAACFYASYNVLYNSFDPLQTQQFQANSYTVSPSADLDISSFNITGNQFVLTTSYASFQHDGFKNPTEGAIITGNFDDLYGDDNYFNWSTNGGWSISMYTNLNQSIDWWDYIGLKTSINSNGLIAIEQEYTNTLFFQNPELNNGRGGDNYTTFNFKPLPTSFVVENHQNVPLTNDMIANLSDILSANYFTYDIASCFANWRSDAVITAAPINVDDNTQYKGTVQFKLTTTNYYQDGVLYPTYELPGIYTLSGYKAYQTTVINPDITSVAFEGKDVDDINNDQIITRVMNNLNSLINDIPSEIDLSAVNVSVSNGYFGEYKDVNITLPAYFNANHELVNENMTYTISLNGFNYKQGKLLAIVLPIVIILMLIIIVASVIWYLKVHKRDESIEYSHIGKMLDKDYWN